MSDVDAYIAALPAPQAQALTRLRGILAAPRLPDHREVIGCAMPGFRRPGKGGRMVAGHTAFARNCGCCPHSGSIIGQFPDLTRGFRTTPGAVSFPPDHPLPEALVLVAARLAEITATGK